MMCILHGSLSFSDMEWIMKLYKSGLAMLIMVGRLALESARSSSFPRATFYHSQVVVPI
jgi:hypothetical protein